jgi:hypothetical protein
MIRFFTAETQRTQREVGLVLNFYVPVMRDSIVRIVNELDE